MKLNHAFIIADLIMNGDMLDQRWNLTTMTALSIGNILQNWQNYEISNIRCLQYMFSSSIKQNRMNKICLLVYALISVLRYIVASQSCTLSMIGKDQKTRGCRAEETKLLRLRKLMDLMHFWDPRRVLRTDVGFHSV